MRRANIVVSVFCLAARLACAQIDIALPTANTALFRGGGPDFYQFVDRDYNGLKSTPWEGGQYGYVRDPVETPAGIVYTRLHKGIDIKPMQRDASGMPLDPVCAIADGRVVHTNATAQWSNFGRYVVIEHDWGGSHYYSLYAHLNRISTMVGEKVSKGHQIGVLGFTGAGIDQRRAHVHLELNLILNRNFEQWHARYFPTEINHHGMYNGLNFAGLDIARFFLSWKRDPSLTVPDFILRQEVMYKVLLPRSPHFDLPRFYPWMLTDRSQTNPPSWEVSFDSTGLPIRIEPSTRHVDTPTASMMKHSPVSYALLTNNTITGSGDHFHLSEAGLRHMHLLISPD